ncbi:MAG: hypothetical protein WC238_04620 [Parcubacteria group bacterium]|jgi:hypothetical protein
MIIGKETITVLQEKPQSPPRKGYIYLYSYNNLLWYMDFEGNEYCLPSDGGVLISQLLSGNVYWESGYTFNVSDCLYMIRGTTYHSEAGTITLNDADPDLDRIDVIFVDTDETIGKITGTPSANPQKPMVNPASQLELTYVLISAGSTSPSILNEQVYQENTEWATSWDSEVGGLVDFESTTDPFVGTYCIKASIDPANPSPNLDGVDIYFDKTGTYDITGAILVLMIKTSKKWLNTTGGLCYLTLKLYNGATLISQTPVVIKDGKYGFDSSVPTWQAIVVPIVDFGASSMIMDRLNIHFNGKWADKSVVIGFDSIFFQGGVPQPTGHQRLHSMINPLDHQPAASADKDKYVHSNPITGEWELVSLQTGTGGGITDVLTELTPYDELELLSFELGGTTYPVTTLRKPTQIVSGGALTVVSEEAREYTVSAAGYFILGAYYESLGVGVILDAPDASHPRIDLIVLTSDSLATKITGTPAANPVKPAMDDATQVLVAEIIVFPTIGGSSPQLVELSGDVIGTGYTGTSIPTVLEEITGAGTFGGTNITLEVEIDAKGRVLEMVEIPISFPTATDLSITSGVGSDHSSSGIKTTFTANENQAFGDVVRINSAGKAQLAKADVIGNATVVAMLVDASVATNGTGTYLLLGFARDDTWNWTKGSWIFLSLTGTTGNTLTDVNPADIPCSAGNVIQLIGVAYTADSIYFNPQLAQIEYKE